LPRRRVNRTDSAANKEDQETLIYVTSRKRQRRLFFSVADASGLSDPCGFAPACLYNLQRFRQLEDTAVNSSAHSVLGYLHSLFPRHCGEQDDDRELLHRFREARDGDAFALLMRRHGPMVLGLARRILGDAHLAEDVFQAAFLLLARKAHTIRRAESLSCWLHGVAFRIALRVRRSHQRRQERETHFHPPSSPSPLEELTAQELLTVLDEELHKLPENQRAPLILCCLEGLSQEEAARRLGCSPTAVKGRLERGRQRLRLRLEKRGLTLPAVFGGTLLLAGSTSPVPAALTQATLQAAMTGASASPAVAVLIEETMRIMFVAKLKAIGAAVVVLALTSTGVGMMALRPQAARENATPAAAADDKPLSAKKRVDLYGDPLPDGAVMRLGTIQRRAVGVRLAVTADGKSIVGARDALCLSIWDAATGELRRKRELPEPWGTSVLSPDGRWLVQTMGAVKESLAIWDVRTVEKVRLLRIEGKPHIWPIAFSRDGKRIAAIGRREYEGGNDHLVRVWNLADGKEIFSKEVRNKRSGHRLAFSPDGKRLLATFLSNSGDRGLYSWDIAGGRQGWLNDDIIGLDSMVFTADGKILTSPWGQAVDLATGRTVKLEKPPPIKGNDAPLTLTPDGCVLLIPTAKGVIVWDMVHGKELRTLQGAGEEIVVLPDGKSIISNNGSLQRWDLETGKPLWSDNFAFGHISTVNAVAFSADGKRLASVSEDGSVRLWDAVSGRPLRVWRAHEPNRPWYLADRKNLDITPDGRWILSCGSEECLKLWDASSDKVVRSIALPPRETSRPDNRPILQVRISADGSRAVGLFGHPGETHKLATWNLKTGQLLACHSVADMLPGFRALSTDGGLLLCNGVLVDGVSGKKMACLEGTLSHPCAISRDGALVFGGSTRKVMKDGRTHKTADGLRVWESATGKVVAHLKSKPWTYQAAFHPNNRLLATNDDGIQLHDAVTGKLLAVRRMPKDVMGSTVCFAFTVDGRRLATGMPDGTILIWEIALPISKPQSLQTKEIESLWTDLADADAAKAWRAVWRLADASQDALGFLRGRVKPYPTAPAELTRKLLADLDSDSFEVREETVKRLKELGLQAEPALRAALAAKPSLEQRRRIEPILAALSEMPEEPSPEGLRQLRALIVLECINSPEAQRLLEEAAQGPPSARLTRQARACLACLH